MPRDFMYIALLGVVLYGCSGKSTEKAPENPSEHARHGHHHRFDDAAGWSKVFDDPARDEWQKPRRVIELLAISSGLTIADIGAGTGYFEPHLARAVGTSGKVIAEDAEPAMVQWLEARATR